ncbi:MAG: hypothetical protein LQ342_005775 [Letrouitia transgressa]|nr:MAG: hypothetical protein LQ342_005775 [Letrouitia transgressa]
MTLEYNSSTVVTYNFAFAGAEVNKSITSKPDVNDIGHQVGSFILYSENPNTNPHWTADDSLVVCFVGINDIRAVYNSPNSGSILDAVFKSYRANIDRLYTVGARNFLLLNIPPIDLSPSYNTNPTSQKIIATTIADFNSRLMTLASGVRRSYADVGAWIFDTHALLSRILSDKSALDLKAAGHTPLVNVSDYCDVYKKAYTERTGAGSGVVEPDLNEPETFDARCKVRMDEYFWFDELHPTWPVHKALTVRIVEELKGLLGS